MRRKNYYPSGSFRRKAIEKSSESVKVQKHLFLLFTISLHSLWAVKCKFSIRLLNCCSNKFEFNFFTSLDLIQCNEKLFLSLHLLNEFFMISILVALAFVYLCIHSEKVNFFFLFCMPFWAPLNFIFFPYDNKYIQCSLLSDSFFILKLKIYIPSTHSMMRHLLWNLITIFAYACRIMYMLISLKHGFFFSLLLIRQFHVNANIHPLISSFALLLLNIS